MVVQDFRLKKLSTPDPGPAGWAGRRTIGGRSGQVVGDGLADEVAHRATEPLRGGLGGLGQVGWHPHAHHLRLAQGGLQPLQRLRRARHPEVAGLDHLLDAPRQLLARVPGAVEPDRLRVEVDVREGIHPLLPCSCSVSPTRPWAPINAASCAAIRLASPGRS
jgi:hypothetical protein